MKDSLINLTYEIELQPDEKITLPEAIANAVGPGRWLLTIQPLNTPTTASSLRSHNAFLSSYVSADEGLYDDYLGRVSENDAQHLRSTWATHIIPQF